MNEHMLWLGAITLLAAIVNGALGYGFSSITVPLALLFTSSRVLNPALIAIEVPLNAYSLWVNRDALPAVWRRVLPVVVGLLPGILAGTMLLSRVSPDWLKLATYGVLLPLILMQAAGIRRPVTAERSAGLVFGAGLGMLYSVTTISGPPLAIALVNQGLDKREFRAALGLIRLVESSLTAVAYIFGRALHHAEHGARPVDCPERRDRRSARGADHQTPASGDVPPHLHEFRRLDRRVWLVEAAARCRAGWWRRLCVAGAGRARR